jgi:hypothetical protein
MIKKLPAQIPFLHKNFREMSFELKIIFLAHLATIIFCFMPWISYVPLYGNTYFDNAFGGVTKIIGILIFLISLGICLIFIAELFKSKFIKLPVAKDVVFIFAGIQQIILLICTWSVLIFMGKGYDLLEIRFGIIFCLLFQIFGIVASYLLTREKEKKEVVKFFHQAEEKIENKAKTLFSKDDSSTKK